MGSSLYDKLADYRKAGIYPFHMPGHKRNMGNYSHTDSYQIDITEIDGFDNLHQAKGIIKAAEERAAALYGSQETHFLVNGSTCGILSAVAGLAGRGGKILLAANSHKAAFHALLLHSCRCEFIYPEINREYGIVGGIRPDDVKELLRKNPDAQAVFLTSPTYDGMISPVREIAEIAHGYGIPLIVDEAHGAHFGFYGPFAGKYGMRSSVREGADVVIHSIHKTLPSYTQTALIHLNGNLIDRERVRRYLGIYQTSSPSYVLMGGIDRCMGILESEGAALFGKWEENLSEFFKIKDELKHIKLLGDEVIGSGGITGRDVGKFLFSTKNTTINGVQLYGILRERYHLQLEMAAGDYCLAISTMMDTEDGFKRLKDALAETDAAIADMPDDGSEGSGILPVKFLKLPKVYEIYEVDDLETERIAFEECEGRVAADFIYAYPPGIPLIVPGERAEHILIFTVEAMREQGLNVIGIEEGKFRVLERQGNRL